MCTITFEGIIVKLVEIFPNKKSLFGGHSPLGDVVEI
jgi:hypothetical protein